MKYSYLVLILCFFVQTSPASLLDVVANKFSVQGDTSAAVGYLGGLCGTGIAVYCIDTFNLQRYVGTTGASAGVIVSTFIAGLVSKYVSNMILN